MSDIVQVHNTYYLLEKFGPHWPRCLEKYVIIERNYDIPALHNLPSVKVLAKLTQF